eukprot:06268_6
MLLFPHLADGILVLQDKVNLVRGAAPVRSEHDSIASRLTGLMSQRLKTPRRRSRMIGTRHSLNTSLMKKPRSPLAGKTRSRFRWQTPRPSSRKIGTTRRMGTGRRLSSIILSAALGVASGSGQLSEILTTRASGIRRSSKILPIRAPGRPAKSRT